jgi:putative transposase
MLWGMDFTCVATCKGFIRVAFDIDSLARTIGGWRASASAHAGHRHCLLDR